MSETPRTDAEANEQYHMELAASRLRYALVQSEFARQLERELNAANERIKRLEEAGDAMHRYYDASSRFKWGEAREIKP